MSQEQTFAEIQMEAASVFSEPASVSLLLCSDGHEQGMGARGKEKGLHKA